MTNLSQLRLDLAAAKAALRQAKDELETAKAIAEQNIINASGGNIGKNEAERQRWLTIQLSGSETYTNALRYLRDCEADIDRLSAEVASTEDQLRADELRVREKLADALLGRREDNAATDYGAMRAFSGAMNDSDMESDHGGYSGATAEFASRRNGRSELQQGQTADDVQWQQHMGTYDRPDTSDWYPER